MVRFAVTFGSAMLLGLCFVIAGSGKLPGQAELIDALLQSFWTPGFAYFIGYCLPWAEIVLGAFLLLGVFPRLVAVLCLPIIAGFMANNAWALNRGLEQFPQCGECFGVFEKILGALSPLQAMVIDIVLLGAALVIVILYQESFWHFSPWFVKRK